MKYLNSNKACKVVTIGSMILFFSRLVPVFPQKYNGVSIWEGGFVVTDAVNAKTKWVIKKYPLRYI